MTDSRGAGNRRLILGASDVIIIVGMTLGLITNALADELENVTADKDAAASIERLAAQRADEAARCFAQAKSNGTVWLPTQRLYDELDNIRALSTKKPVDPKVSQKLKSLSDTILEHCELIENQHALERARYLLATLKNADEDLVRAIRDMLLAADGQGALMLLEGLLRESAAVSD